MDSDRSIASIVRSFREEAKLNPYRGRFWPDGGGRTRRRLTLWGIVAVAIFGAGCALLPLLDDNFPTALHGPGLVWNLFLLRAVVLLHAAWRTRAFAATQTAPAVMQQIALTPLRPRALVLGWALVGFCRAAPISLVAFAAVAPFMATASAASLLIAAGEALQWGILQLLAALVAANQTLKFAQRREAIASAWIATFITYPLAFFLRAALILGGLLMLVFIVAVAWFIPQNFAGPASTPVVLRPIVSALAWAGGNLYWVGWTAGLAFWGGVPLGAIYEIRRQLDIAQQYRDEMRGYLDLPPGRTGR